MRRIGRLWSLPLSHGESPLPEKESRVIPEGPHLSKSRSAIETASCRSRRCDRAPGRSLGTACKRSVILTSLVLVRPRPGVVVREDHRSRSAERLRSTSVDAPSHGRPCPGTARKRVNRCCASRNNARTPLAPAAEAVCRYRRTSAEAPKTSSRTNAHARYRSASATAATIVALPPMPRVRIRRPAHPAGAQRRIAASRSRASYCIARETRPQQQRQQFGIGESVGAARQQPFAGTLADRPICDRHGSHPVNAARAGECVLAPKWYL